MKTAISLPDDLFDDADRLARRLGKSRSQLYAEAVAEYVARHDPSTVTDAMNAVINELGPARDPAIEAAARATLERSEW